MTGGASVARIRGDRQIHNTTNKEAHMSKLLTALIAAGFAFGL